MFKFLISILILFSLSFSDVLYPENNSTLNTTHILFEWEQVPDAVSYRITWIYGNNPDIIVGEENTESLIYINTEIFDWDTPYVWHVQPIFSDGSTGSYITNSEGTSHLNYFNIGSARSDAYSINNNPSQYSDGITLFSSFFDYYSAAIDQDGNEIWNSANEDIVFYNTDYYGQLFGCKLDNDLEHNLPGFEFSLDGEGIWYEPNDEFLHHDLIQLPNGNYMGIVENLNIGPIPYGEWTPSFQALGYQADGFTPEFTWVGDRIVEWDQNGNEVWSWSTFDYYNMQDYDTYGDTWWQGFYDGRYDWTHINAIAFSEEENAVYVSCRHLSRITKIDHSTGEIIWNMGLEMPSGDVDCGQDLGFSFQHSVTVLENGNIVTLDNGNISTFLNDTDYPTTRALEIQVNELNNSCEASLAWSYDLSEELFGFASGNVQKLENGNYLATTVGDGGTSIEITPNHEIVWEGKYNLSLPNGAVYRANRLSSLYPVAFSVIVEDLYIEDGNIIVEDEVNIQIHNNGSTNETFHIPFLDYYINIDSNDIGYVNIPIESNSEVIQIDIIPIHREDLAKQITVYSILGCTDINACNYEPDATEDDGSCIYPEGNYDCEGNCLSNIDCQDECGGDAYILPGTYTYYHNPSDNNCTGNTSEFNPMDENGVLSWTFNINGNTINDGNGSNLNYTIENCQINVYNEGEWTGELYIQDNGWISGCQNYGQTAIVLIYEDYLGCTDINACNYNENAIFNNGNCEYFDSELVCDCSDSPPTFECWDGSLSCSQTDCPENLCGDNFTYFDTNEIPNSTIVIDGSQCFSNIDLDVLNDIIQLNNLENLDAINLGTQNWFNGHITRLTIGNFYDGGNVILTTLPESIGDFPNIAILYLNYNELTSLPDSITNLTNLIYLVLSFNQLTHLPENIGNLSNMIWFDLGYNSIEYLPDSIGDFSIIQYLWIFNNQLSSLPESICNLNLDWNSLDNNFLPYFGSGGNMLCGELPECVANSQNIDTSIDPLYYSFLITVEQDCTECGQVDISGDGVVNVIDITSLVNFILSDENTSDENLCTFDLTGDDIINVIDIVLLVNTILDN